MTENVSKNVLLIGYGNPAREDDGLGPAAAEAIEKLALNGVTVDSNYQLTVEDAAAVAEHDYTVFVDASMKGKEPFSFSRLSPAPDPVGVRSGRGHMSFSSHSVEPETVLGLSKDLFNASPEAYILGIRGYSFEMFHETMTKQASENLEKAVRFLISILSTGRSFRDTAVEDE